MQASPTIFLSYSHRDQHWLERVQTHLAPLERNNTISIWADTNIRPGDNWRQEIENALRTCQCAILLVSAYFLSSDFIQRMELPALLSRAKESGTRILPIIVRPCHFHGSPLSIFQAVNQPEKPLSSLRTAQQDTVLAHLVQQIAELHASSVPVNATAQTRSPTNARQWPESSHTDFLCYARDRLLQAKHAILMGTGLNIIHNDTFRKDLLRQYAEDCKKSLDIYLGYPCSPSVEARLIEEELGLIRPPVGKTGLLSRISTITKEWMDLGSPAHIHIRLFTHYPSFALICIDHKDYLFYPYGISTLGNFSPVVHFSRDCDQDAAAIKFFDMQLLLLEQRSFPSELILNDTRKYRERLSSLQPFALYIVPDKLSSLYKIGSKILGYDVRKARGLTGRMWPKYVGIAKNYGFHVTVCDVLYFASAAEVDYAIEEARFLSRGFSPFFLENIRAASGVPNSSSISLIFEEPTGALESIHCECVFRIYRRAISSNYSSHAEEPLRDGLYRRAQLMVERYNAPYILGQYKPHFTLLTKVPPSEMQPITESINDMIRASGQNRVRVDSLSVLQKGGNSKMWVVRDEIYLPRG